MKKGILITASFVALSLISCKKNESGNKGIVKSDSSEQVILADNGKVDSTIGYNVDVNGKKTIKTDYVYKATDGTLVKVVYNYDPKENNVSITSNKKTFILDKIKSTGSETTYEKDEMKATVKGDSLILHQGDNIIQLVKTKI
ncbi:hypothetical protein NZ698_12060 [Chryseobacterium sp. PBS4-4]|uniref:Copper resistance protein NlpE n=1 Tax=Chryseobacterium edaphi TaxID=2976532 RepID=A0ABT2W6V9_9FLAO|nr:hypothetical protein [Chryseobacterium edaphi]MCU7617934.1 hypothetical protein [Chryseobacterium edaphi]